jgi:hypothetical protein
LEETMSRPDVVPVAELIKRYREFTEPLCRQFAERARGCAPDFNLFRLLGLERDEVKTSALLAELLNPEGAHGQRHLFLKAFLQRCHAKGQCADFPSVAEVESHAWEVFPEKPIADGRLDIVVQSAGLGFLLVIENKIGAGDQPDQLDRYYRWLQRQDRYQMNRVLVYLTPDGRQSATAQACQYVRLSYDDIAGCLGEAMQDIPAPRVREAVTQYQEIAQALCSTGGERTMSSPSSDYESDVQEFLMGPENLKSALDIGDHVEKIRDRLLVQFWRSLEKAVRNHIGERTGWLLTLDPEAALTIRGVWGGGLQLRPDPIPAARHVEPKVVHDSSSLIFGAGWSPNLPREDAARLRQEHPALADLRRLLAESGYVVPEYGYWFGRKLLQNRPMRETATLLRIAEGTLAEEVAGEFVAFIDRFLQAIERTNAELVGEPPG